MNDRAEAPNITGVFARIYVEDLEAALPLYGELADGAPPFRFDYRDLSLATVGPFLLIQGAGEEIRSHTSTISVRDLSRVAAAIERAGGTLLEGPAPAPNGPRLIARHPDGTVLEYLELHRQLAG